jgi:hypothetical protein
LACRMTTPLLPDDTATAASQSFGPFGPLSGSLRVPTILPLFPSLVAIDPAVANWGKATEEDCVGQTDPLAEIGEQHSFRFSPRQLIYRLYSRLDRNPSSSVSTLPPISRLQPMCYTLPSPTVRRLSSPQSIWTSGLSKLASSLKPNLPIRLAAPPSCAETTSRFQ